jgi:hypothetical protein
MSAVFLLWIQIAKGCDLVLISTVQPNFDGWEGFSSMTQLGKYRALGGTLADGGEGF